MIGAWPPHGCCTWWLHCSIPHAGACSNFPTWGTQLRMDATGSQTVGHVNPGQYKLYSTGNKVTFVNMCADDNQKSMSIRVGFWTLPVQSTSVNPCNPWVMAMCCKWILATVLRLMLSQPTPCHGLHRRTALTVMGGGSSLAPPSVIHFNALEGQIPTRSAQVAARALFGTLTRTQPGKAWLHTAIQTSKLHVPTHSTLTAAAMIAVYQQLGTIHTH